ncbi:hypothetical protein C6P42_004587, partial [Pichia californica]
EKSELPSAYNSARVKDENELEKSNSKLKDPFDNTSKDIPIRVLSPNSRSSIIPFQHPHQAPTSTSTATSTSAIIPLTSSASTVAAHLPRPYSPNGRLSPVSYRQNVFFQESRQRYPSVFIDPCAPVPNSNSSQVPERAKSPSIISQQQQQQQQSSSHQSQQLPAPSFLMSPRKIRSITDNNLPPISSISSISSQISLPQSPIHSISSTKSNHFQFSRNSSGVSTHSNQLRPSIYDIHQQTTNSSISTHNSIFSNGSSISSNGSIGSRYGSSISSILNDDRRLPSLTNGSISGITLPVTSSSLKTVTSYINDSSSSRDTSHSPESHIRQDKIQSDSISTVNINNSDSVSASNETTRTTNKTKTTNTTKSMSNIAKILNHTEETVSK